MTATNPEPNDDTATSNRFWDYYSTHVIILVIVVVIGLGTVVYHSLEDWGWVDSFYFSVITLTTVGYGDLAPSSSASKLFTAFYVVIGISLLAAALNEVLKRRGRRMKERQSMRRQRRAEGRSG